MTINFPLTPSIEVILKDKGSPVPPDTLAAEGVIFRFVGIDVVMIVSRVASFTETAILPEPPFRPIAIAGLALNVH